MATVGYIEPKDREAIRAMKIYAIVAVGHKKESWLQTHTNHWCLYLKTSETTSNSKGWKGTVVVSELKYPLSNQALSENNVRIIDGLNVADIVDVITENGRDKYEFDGDGVGCRKWTTHTLDLLTAKGWATESDAEAAKQNILKLWPDGTFLPLDAGAYYT